MKISRSRLKTIIREELQRYTIGTRRLIEQAIDYICPPATQDVDVNTENRNATREDHDYGPMNPMEPSQGYWESMSQKWEGASPEEAMGMRCSNCVAFDISPRMQKCMPMADELDDISDDNEELDPMLVADMEMVDMPEDAFPGFPDGDFVGFGYCWMHHFKCHSARACDTWAGGGPIQEDEGSHGWQDKAPFEE